MLTLGGVDSEDIDDCLVAILLRFVLTSGDATEIKLRDLKPAADYFVKYVHC